MCRHKYISTLFVAFLPELLLYAGMLPFFGCAGNEELTTASTSASAVGTSITPAQTASRFPVRWLNPHQAREEIRSNPDLFLMCVCDRTSYENGHIAGSALIPAVGIAQFIENNTLWPEINNNRTPRKDQPVLIYCYWKNCVCPTIPTWSEYALKALRKKGFTNIAVITGGMPRWIKEGLPIQKTAR